MKLTRLFALLTVVGIFCFSAWGSDTKSPLILQKHFKKEDIKLQRGIETSTSAGSGLYELTESIDGYLAGSKWVIKENPLHWLISEYVASKLYQRFLGKEVVSNTLWVADAEQSDKFYLAIRFIDGITLFANATSENSLTIAEGLPFRCVTGGCLVQDGILIDEMGLSSTRPLSVIDSQEVHGAELAMLVSALLDESDAAWGNNYGLYRNDHGYQVVRIDFDDSLKFLDRFKITPGMTIDTINPDLRAKLSSLGWTVEAFLAYYNNGIGPYAPFFIASIFLLNNHLVGRIDGKRMLEAAEQIMTVAWEEIESIVISALDDVLQLVGNNRIKKIYKFNSSLAKPYFSSKGSSIKKLEQGILAVLKERYDSLMRSTLCLGLKEALRDNNPDKVRALLKADFLDADYKCEDLERTAIAEAGGLRIGFSLLKDLATYLKTQGLATELFNAYFENLRDADLEISVSEIY